MKPGNIMLSKSQLKTIRSLQTKKHRQKYQKFAVEGEKIIREALLECPERIESIVVTTGQFQKHDFPVPTSTNWLETDARTMASMSSLQTPPGILAVVRMNSSEKSNSITDDWIIFLDGVRDPGNLGTIIRTADWFGYTSVLLGPGCVDWSNPKVIQASMGSVFRIQCLDMSLEQVQTQWPELPLFAADMQGEDVTQVKWPKHGVLVMGSESHGLSITKTSHRMERVCIKKDPGSRAESLNVAMAAGILMHRISGRIFNRSL